MIIIIIIIIIMMMMMMMMMMMECYGMVIDLKCSSFTIGSHFLILTQETFNLEGM